MSSETKKILLIGAKGYDRAKEGLRLDCVPWDSLSKISNVRDYDTLVINLLNPNRDFVERKVNWAKFNELLDFAAASDILIHQGRIVVLGDPRFVIPSKETGTKNFLDWTGATFAWDSQPGDTVKLTESDGYGEFENYAKHLRKWNYSLGRCSLNKAAFAEQWNLAALQEKDVDPWVKVWTACSNRYEHPLAFCIQHQLANSYGRSEISYGFIYLLPETSLDEDEALQIVLRDFCDAASELPEPEWISDYSVPRQKPIDEKIAQIRATLKEQQTALEKATTERTAARSCLKLLYEREFALEPVVRNVLGQLGAKVEEPVEKNKEDGWITIEVAGTTYEGVLEIKSAKSDQFNEDGRKQILDWIDRGRTLRHKNYKGIFIGNSAVTKPVEDRPNAFSDSWRKAAELSQICAMKSEELYYIYLLHKQGKLNLDDFWTKLFTTNGIFDIKPFLPKKEAKDA